MRASPPGPPLPDFASYCAAWQRLHAGYDLATGSAWVRGWLRLQYRLAGPFATVGVGPSALTSLTVVLAGASLAAAAAGGRWALGAAALVMLSAVGDGLDGAVAVLTDRVTSWGYVLDSMVDRVNELLFLAALAALGAALPLVIACAVVMFLLEYVRARGGSAGQGEITAITVGERPNRIICCVLGMAAAGAAPAAAGQAAGVAVAVLAALSLIGLVQLVVAVRRQLRG
jgi:phosphatidylglycerophosphate synthase